MARSETRGGTTVQSVARALEIIDCFGETRELGISEISERMNLSKSTIYGLVNTLAAYGYLKQTGPNKKYRLDIRLFELGNLVQRRMDARGEAKPFCETLAEKYGTTVHLATYSDGEVVYIDKVDNSKSVVVYSQIGKRAPMYCTGVGKAMLAHLPREYAEYYVLNRPLRKLTENTITTRKALEKELDVVREQGYARDNEETERGLCCVAAPVFTSDGEPQMAISVSFPFGRLSALDVEAVARDVMFSAGQITERLGGRPRA